MGRSLLPSLKEKKRYIKINVLEGILDKKLLINELKFFLGILGYSRAGINYPKENIIRCNTKSLIDVKAALCMINQQVIINQISGNIRG